MLLVERFYIWSDLDGVQFLGPWAVGTLTALLQGNFALPEPQPVITMADPSQKSLKTAWEVAYHRFRPVNVRGRACLEEMKDIVTAQGLPVTVTALSGRSPALHEMTKEKLQRAGYQEILDDYQLNKSTSSSGWKEWVIAQALFNEPSSFHVHLEDDLKAALRVARTDPDRVVVFLLKNPTSSPRLLARNGITLPANVIVVKNFQEVLTAMKTRIFPE